MDIAFHFSWVRPKDGLAESYGKECLHSENTARLFPSVSESSAIAQCWRKLDEGGLFNFSNSSRCVVASQGSFSLHFRKHY